MPSRNASNRPTDLERAVVACVGTTTNIYAEVSDDGRTVSFNGRGEDELSGATYQEILCTLKRVGIPASVEARFGNTRALDGMQQAAWKGYEASWNYHPDGGPNVVLSMTS